MPLLYTVKFYKGASSHGPILYKFLIHHVKSGHRVTDEKASYVLY